LELRRVAARILASLAAVDPEGVFGSPVPLDVVPGYLDVVASPMDLGTMAGKRYRCLGDLRKDLELVVGNCLSFNAEGSPFFDLALCLAAAAHPAYLAATGRDQGQHQAKRPRRN
jgi:hypothetical protein